MSLSHFHFKTLVKAADLTTFKVGGAIPYYVKVSSSDDLLTVVRAAKKRHIPYVIVAGGSNIVCGDGPLLKLVIHYRSRVTDRTIIVKKNTIICDAGVLLKDLITNAINRGLGGLEALSGIPGTVGGAIVGNAGAYGQTISDHLVSAEIFDGTKIRTITKTGCKFTYRDSIFKHKDWLVLSATFALRKGDSKALSAKSKSIIATRNKKYPPGLKCPGSFFKNVLIKDISKQTLAKIDQSKIIDGKIPAGYLLEVVGARGMRQGGIYIPDYHGNLLVNDGTGTYRDVVILVKKLKSKVAKRFGITLEEEVRYML